MASYLRKAVALGPAGTISPNPASNAQDIRFNRGYGLENIIYLSDSQTKWVRFWLHTPTIWPLENSINTPVLQALDNQIALAKYYGFSVVLTMHHELSRWINQTDIRTSLAGSDNRPYTWRRPYNIDIDGPWARVLQSFMIRYNRFNANAPVGGLAKVDVFEVMNEPNLLMWPHDDLDDGNGPIERCIAIMMKRARQLVGQVQNTPIIGAPCVHDTDADKMVGTAPNVRRVQTNYKSFTRDVLSWLRTIDHYQVRDTSGNLNAQSMLWTAHNYGDVIYDHGPDTLAPDRDAADRTGTANRYRSRRVPRSQQISETLSEELWQGWPNNGASDYLWLTEGGGDLPSINATYYGNAGSAQTQRDAQSFLVARNMERMKTDDLGRGVGMLTNYLFYSDSRPGVFGDSGLFDDISQGGVVRPVYNQWKTRVPARV